MTVHAPLPPDLDTLARRARELRTLIVDTSFAARKGHIGSALSIADLMVALWSAVMRHPGTDHPERDRFVLGKGHAALALHGCLHQAGILSRSQLESYCQPGSDICAHPMHRVPGIELSTGSLGQALSVACGQALALRRRGSQARVFTLLSDGECNEGQVWEAAMFAGHHELGNLQVIIDANGSQCMGPTRDILTLRDPSAAWRAFGWHVDEVDGHDMAAICSPLQAAPGSRPRLLWAKTVLGRGVSFMEGDFEWHYRVPSPPQHAMAIEEINRP